MHRPCCTLFRHHPSWFYQRCTMTSTFSWQIINESLSPSLPLLKKIYQVYKCCVIIRRIQLKQSKKFSIYHIIHDYVFIHNNSQATSLWAGYQATIKYIFPSLILREAFLVSVFSDFRLQHFIFWFNKLLSRVLLNDNVAWFFEEASLTSKIGKGGPMVWRGLARITVSSLSTKYILNSQIII